MNTDLAEKIARLCALRNRGSKFGIDRMRLLANALGNPQQTLRIVHIAGTNGKGSTAAMTDAILRAHGLRVGLYTSPHLVRLGERVRIDGVPLSDEKICARADALFAVAKIFGSPGDEDYPSFFEMMTAIALVEFSREKCDSAVLETGLGGRLDATNIADTPVVCAITSIGLDHTEMLGGTLREIAREKAGIVKRGVPVVIGLLPKEAEEEIRHIARERSAQVVSVREKFGNAIEHFPKTNLFGDHQRGNAACALLIAEIFLRASGKFFDAERSREALKTVRWRARWEEIRLADGRRLIVDVAHNEEGAAAIDRALDALFASTGKRPQIITGVLGAERARPLLAVFARHAAAIHLVRPAQERACSFAELRACVPANFRGKIFESSVKKLFPRPGVCATGTPEGEPLVVAGSCYLAGETLAALNGEEADSALQDRLPPAAQSVPAK